MAGPKAAAAEAPALTHTSHHYGAHDLQALSVWQWTHPPPRDPSHPPPYWLIYLHGGAWRDPRVDRTSSLPTQECLAHPTTRSDPGPGPSPGPGLGGDIPDLRRRIAAFASLDYRLSPHPDFPQDPSSSLASSLRAARHPDHVDDVRAALALLAREHGLGGPAAPYVLYGHSAGAMLAFQVLLLPQTAAAGAAGANTALPVPVPAAIVGFEGIYDPRGLVARLGDGYRGFVTQAFGEVEDAWDAVSPAAVLRAGKGSLRAAWKGGKVAVLAHSPADELVDMAETDGMEDALKADGVHCLVFRDLVGGHDEVRRDGRNMARVLCRTISELDRPSVVRR